MFFLVMFWIPVSLVLGCILALAVWLLTRNQRRPKGLLLLAAVLLPCLSLFWIVTIVLVTEGAPDVVGPPNAFKSFAVLLTAFGPPAFATWKLIAALWQFFANSPPGSDSSETGV